MPWWRSRGCISSHKEFFLQRNSKHFQLEFLFPAGVSTAVNKSWRLSPKQASHTRQNTKRLKLDYEGRYKEAFKEVATNLVAAEKSTKYVRSTEPKSFISWVESGWHRAQCYYTTLSSRQKSKEEGTKAINSKQVLCSCGNIRCGAPGRWWLVKRHGSQKLDRGLDCWWNTVLGVIPSGIGVEEGLSRVFYALQAANKILIKDVCAEWTTYDNLNQRFDDV